MYNYLNSNSINNFYIIKLIKNKILHSLWKGIKVFLFTSALQDFNAIVLKYSK